MSLVRRISKNQEIFFSENRAPRFFGAPDCHPSTLIDLLNLALAIKVCREPICMISEGYRTHRGVTSPMNFKSMTFFFFLEKRAPADFGALAAIQVL